MGKNKKKEIHKKYELIFKCYLLNILFIFIHKQNNKFYCKITIIHLDYYIKSVYNFDLKGYSRKTKVDVFE